MKSRTVIFSAAIAALSLGLFIDATALAQNPNAKRQRREAGMPAPDMADVKYGPHERNVLDFWKAKSDKPTPLAVFIHGGGFRAGGKEQVSAGFVTALLDKGISVMSISYRLSPEVTFPAHYMDCARAIQFARSKAKEWNIDPKRVSSSGGSAGAGTSLWIGFHDDMADPDNSDPVLRESTRLTCMAVSGAQSTYDPRTITEWVGEAAARHPALEGFYGYTWDQYKDPKAVELFEKAAAINYLTADDPPVWASYAEPRGPLPADAKPGTGIHHINFGLRMKEKMDKLGIECVIRHKDEGGNLNQEMVDFLVKHLTEGK